ncbi:nicotinate (nicotinamide) nucleotide adenylyltransferase [Desulfopila aestuarii]|uniref:Probable nicotinate-nucleotide adenylyltransferase n=1 Tax=Desulfopila aestuarii DSM 18488 TaxID=1121416 RepID=A0A1M7Y402_9BACT|nr:nicotinate (nicotinamide) nucleotide adenylyltransferase [Desulfopila aestuarii]SHO46920.1 nicotinate-nucleotide adenylyltransferase [Desulfopila aestuarii DSM 18488]
MMRIGLLGGTFDPVHDGHLQLALAAKNELSLDNVLLIPAASPPHKCNREVTSFHHRREMLLLALVGTRGLTPCFIEGELPTPSYTIDTIRILQKQDDTPVEYFFIIGVDAFADLLTWKEYEELLRRVRLIVARRKGFSALDKLDEIAVTLDYEQLPDLWRSRSGFKDILFLRSQPRQISSSLVRRLLTSGVACVPGVRQEVVDYAMHHHLYIAESS